MKAYLHIQVWDHSIQAWQNQAERFYSTSEASALNRAIAAAEQLIAAGVVTAEDIRVVSTIVTPVWPDDDQNA